jgi:hypothetical protein
MERPDTNCCQISFATFIDMTYRIGVFVEINEWAIGLWLRLRRCPACNSSGFRIEVRVGWSIECVFRGMVV